jgi:RNA polymerase sigma factor (sigma-70 family)
MRSSHARSTPPGPAEFPRRDRNPEPPCGVYSHEHRRWTPLDDQADEALVARARTGDLDAYERLVARHTAPAHRTAVLLGAGDDADDVVQEAFVKAFGRLRQYRGDSSFRGWLCTIVANETRNLHRSRRRRDGLTIRFALREDPRVAGPDAPVESVLAAERRGVLLDALRDLDGRHRDVVVCRFLLDLSEAETAEALGWPKGTVKSRTARALARLRVRIGSGVEVGHG